MKVFIVHYSKLVDRKKHILQQFEKHNITDYEFIEIDRDELDKQNIDMYQENYSKSQIAISLSHFYAYKEISEKYENALILEDDVVLSENFSVVLNQYLNQLPQDYDMLFIGDGCNLHIENYKITPNQLIYEKCLYPTNWGGGGATRCTDSYIVSKKCAIKICDYIKNLSYKINLPVDCWLNIASVDNNFKVYWAEPTIVTQGTQNGLFVTSY
jgi:GR25 family glycosyltransferase involved in LPS biosynthesis